MVEVQMALVVMVIPAWEVVVLVVIPTTRETVVWDRVAPTAKAFPWPPHQTPGKTIGTKMMQKCLAQSNKIVPDSKLVTVAQVSMMLFWKTTQLKETPRALWKRIHRGVKKSFPALCLALVLRMESLFIRAMVPSFRKVGVWVIVRKMFVRLQLSHLVLMG
jgi:hypothetical protein